MDHLFAERKARAVVKPVAGEMADDQEIRPDLKLLRRSVELAVAFGAVKLLHAAGVPGSALHLVPGDGNIGALLVGHARVAGVAFTGSADVASSINRMLAAKDRPIAPLIAETGGINAMIVDATALPEQVTDDVIASSFRSAGRRCSALRLLCA